MIADLPLVPHRGLTWFIIPLAVSKQEPSLHMPH